MSQVIEFKRKTLYEPSNAIIFARKYAKKTGIKKLNFRKLLAKRSEYLMLQSLLSK